MVYDHYRNKVQKLEKTHLSSGEPKKKETYHRNVEKLNKAKQEFDAENGKLDTLLERVQSKSEVLID